MWLFRRNILKKGCLVLYILSILFGCFICSLPVTAPALIYFSTPLLYRVRPKVACLENKIPTEVEKIVIQPIFPDDEGKEISISDTQKIQLAQQFLQQHLDECVEYDITDMVVDEMLSIELYHDSEVISRYYIGPYYVSTAPFGIPPSKWQLVDPVERYQFLKSIGFQTGSVDPIFVGVNFFCSFGEK